MASDGVSRYSLSVAACVVNDVCCLSFLLSHYILSIIYSNVLLLFCVSIVSGRWNEFLGEICGVVLCGPLNTPIING